MNFSKNFFQRLFFPFSESVSRIAVRAAQVTSGQPNKNARQACKSTFTLQAQINFVDHQCLRHRNFDFRILIFDCQICLSTFSTQPLSLLFGSLHPSNSRACALEQDHFPPIAPSTTPIHPLLLRLSPVCSQNPPENERDKPHDNLAATEVPERNNWSPRRRPTKSLDKLLASFITRKANVFVRCFISDSVIDLDGVMLD